MLAARPEIEEVHQGCMWADGRELLSYVPGVTTMDNSELAIRNLRNEDGRHCCSGPAA